MVSTPPANMRLLSPLAAARPPPSSSSQSAHTSPARDGFASSSASFAHAAGIGANSSGGLQQRRPLHARVDSSDSELDVRPAPLGSPAAVVSAARQRRAFVRLVGGLWPFPLRSASTYACLGGMLILSLVVVDELATTLRRQHHDEAAAHSSSERRGSEPELLHILRHSFLYRLALCASFLVVVFVHGLVVHKGRASSRRRRDNNNALSEGGANPSSPMTYAGVVRKSVSFAHRSGGESSGAEESPALRPLGASVAAAAMISLAPSARPATRKRLQLFFALALLLALCGVAFEVYLAVVSHGSNEAVVIPVKAAPSASAVAEAWWSSLGAAVSNLWASCSLSLLTRGLLLLVWCAACGLLSYYAWYRKAIGTRKSRGPLKRNRAAAQLEDVAEATTDEESDGQDDSEAEEETAQRKISEDEEVVAEAVAAASLSSAAASSSGTPAAASSVSHSPPPVVVAPLDSDSAAGAFLLASDSESEEELDSEDDGGLAAAGLLPAGGGHKRKDSSAMGGRPASFPVPSTAELLLAEKLDASLFFHPEQIQNQWKQGPNGTLLSSSSHTPQHLGSSSATIAPPPGGRDHKSLSASPATMPLHSRAVHRRASDSGKVHTPVAPSPATPAAAHISPPGVAGPSVAASSASPSTGSGSSSASPSFALPLSTHASSPLNIATLFHLASTKFIASLSQADFHNILLEMEWISVAEGEDVFKRGERYHTPPPTQQQPAQQDQQPHATTPSNPSQQQQPQRDGMFIVVSGTVGALNPSNPTQLLHTAHQGDSFGELEFLFSHLSRSVTMRALTPVQLLRIPTSLGRIWNAGGAFSFSGGAITGGNGNASADDVAASARSLAASSETESVLPFVGPSGTPGSTVVQTAVNEELRSDILLSFIRTTLARQWRSAQFILDHFLHIPLDDEYVIAMRPPSPVAAGGAAAALASSAVSSTPASRYFSPQFASFFPEDSLLLRSMTERASAQVELSANQMLFEEGTYRSDQLFVVLSGSVQLTSTRDAAMHHGAASSSASASPPSSTGCTAPMILGPGSVLNAVAYFTDTTQTHTCKAAAEGVTRVAWLNRADLAVPDAEILRLAQLVCAVLAPTLAQYQALGFQRLWIRAGTLVFAEGEACESLHVISSGRVRIVTGKMKRRKRRTSVSTPVQSAPTSSNPSPYQRASSATPSSTAAAFLHPSGIDLTPFTEAHKYASTLNTAGGGVGTGVVSSNGASTAGTTPRIKFELVAGEMVGELSFFNGIGDGDDFHPQPNASSSSKASPTHGSTALCTKDTELLKISRACFANLSRLYPRTLMKLLAIVSQRMRNMMAAHSSGEGMSSTGSKQASVLSSIPRSPFLRTPTSGGSGACCSVCLLTSSPSVPLQDFALNLSVSLSQHGRTMLLTPLHVDRVLGEGTCANLNSYAVRSLLAYWLAHVEQHYAFCLFVCDSQVSAWTRQCTRQADLTLIIANADNTKDAASNSNGGSAVSEIDTDTDGDDDEVEDDEESPEALARIRRRRLAACRRTAVSRFERAVVWDESPVVTDANSFRNKLPCAELGVCEPSGRTPKKHASAATSRSLSAAFSPTLRPSPPPRDASSSVPTASSLVASTGGNGTPATLRATGNYSRCAPRMNFALRDLVLLHPPTTVLPRGTRFWFGARPQLHRFHHVQLGCAEHMDRLARYVAGKSIGVVLSGGGARGLAHLGVLQSFAEQQVPVDYIGGTSQGSFMGALYASQAQHHPAALSQMRVRTHALAERMGSIKSLLSDATFPMLSYFAGAKFGANIRELLGGRTRIEDLWIPFFLVTTNLSQADMCVHDTGRLWKSVRASMTVLDYLPPLQMSTQWPDLLIDGGYTNNLPVDVMHGLFQPSFVVGIDVENKAAEEKLTRVSYYGWYLSGWWLLRKRVTEWLKGGYIVAAVNALKRLGGGGHMETPPAFFHLPKFAELIGSLVYINHNRNIRNSLASKLIDLYIRPDLGLTALLDYHREAEIVQIGYACTKVKLTEWRLKNSALLPKATPPPPFVQQQQQQYAAPSPTVHAQVTAASGGAFKTPPVNAQSVADHPASTLVGVVAPALTLAPAESPILRGRKSSASSRASMGPFVAPPSLTFTHDLAASLSTASASPMMRSSSGAGTGPGRGHTPSSTSASPALAPLGSTAAGAAGSAAGSIVPASASSSSGASASIPPPPLEVRAHSELAMLPSLAEMHQQERTAAIFTHEQRAAAAAAAADAGASAPTGSPPQSALGLMQQAASSGSSSSGGSGSRPATPMSTRPRRNSNSTIAVAAAGSPSAATAAADDSLLSKVMLQQPTLRRNVSEPGVHLDD